MSEAHRWLKGHCYCGAVQFEVEDAFLYAAYCHCSKCRRRSGSAFNALGGIEADKLRVTVGADQLLRRCESAKGYDTLCSQCYSPLFAVFHGQARLHVQLGSLTDAPSRAPDQHFMVGSKAAWYTITDALPQYAEFPPG